MSRRQRITIEIRGKPWRREVRFPYDRLALAILKQLIDDPLREWDRTERVWYVFDEESLRRFVRVARARGFVVIEHDRPRHRVAFSDPMSIGDVLAETFGPDDGRADS